MNLDRVWTLLYHWKVGAQKKYIVTIDSQCDQIYGEINSYLKAFIGSIIDAF